MQLFFLNISINSEFNDFTVDEKYGLRFENVAGDETWLPSDEFLCKPVEPEMLLSKIEELLPKV